MKRIAIAGNPNSGKTTVFNSLSGRNERVGNWAGVTVAKNLPGAYGMDAYTNDEAEATSFIQNENIDVIINVVDAANLERSLFFTMQLVETGIPVVIALNKSDITRRRKTKIDRILLQDKLGVVGVHFTQATSRRGLREVVADALNQINERDENDGQKPTKKRRYQRHRFKSSRKKCGCE